MVIYSLYTYHAYIHFNVVIQRIIINSFLLHLADDNSTAERLFHEIRILCYVPCKDSDMENKAVHVMKTWGRHCNQLLFITQQHHQGFPTVSVQKSVMFLFFLSKSWLGRYQNRQWKKPRILANRPIICIRNFKRLAQDDLFVYYIVFVSIRWQ